jgi:hypothetical protein
MGKFLLSPATRAAMDYCRRLVHAIGQNKCGIGSCHKYSKQFQYVRDREHQTQFVLARCYISTTRIRIFSSLLLASISIDASSTSVMTCTGVRGREEEADTMRRVERCNDYESVRTFAWICVAAFIA